MTPRNGYALAARQKKAARLLVECAARDITAAQVRSLDNEGREALAALAGVTKASGETWRIVIDDLDKLGTIRAALPDDPFAGL